MDSIERWREALISILQAHAAIPYSHGEFGSQLLIDREHERYAILDVGWDGPRRVHGTLVHVEIIDGRFWIQYDGTEEGIANELLAVGVPRDRIVLAFKPPSLRKHTGFAA